MRLDKDVILRRLAEWIAHNTINWYTPDWLKRRTDLAVRLMPALEPFADMVLREITRTVDHELHTLSVTIGNRDEIRRVIQEVIGDDKPPAD